MKLKIKTIELQPDKYGQHIKITKIGLYDENDKWIRWVKLNDELIKVLTEKFILI
jgi:hypothetical protein